MPTDSVTAHDSGPTTEPPSGGGGRCARQPPRPTAGEPVHGRPGQPEVVIVGDSLTGGNDSYIRPTLRASWTRCTGRGAERPPHCDVGPAAGLPRLGDRAHSRHSASAGVDPELWVIQLGTNDLGMVKNCGCADPVAFAGDLIDRLLEALPPDRPVAWVTVMNRADYGVTNTFNEALRRRAVTNPYMRLIDWARLSLERPDWFVDAVHQTNRGVVQFTRMYIDEIRALLAEPPGPTPRSGGSAARRASRHSLGGCDQPADRMHRSRAYPSVTLRDWRP